MKKYFIGFGIFIFLLLAIFVYKQLTYTHMIIRFKELRPIHSVIPVYYKGLVIGKVIGQKHSKDYQHTLMKVVLYPKDLHLPSNTEVYLKKEKKNKKEYDFIEFVYPKEPNQELLSNGSVIDGIATVDIETFMKNQKPEDLETIRQNLTLASENLNMTIEAIGQLFVILQDMVKENQPNLLGATHNMKQTTENINSATSKINTSIKEEQFSRIFDSVEYSGKNIQMITGGLNLTTNDINNSLPMITSSVKSVNEILDNVNIITCGVRQTLAKSFGGLRLLFGRSICKKNNLDCKK